MADQGGIEFLLDITAKLDGATKMVRELSKVEAALAKADAAGKKMERNTDSHFKRMKRWVSDFGSEASKSFAGMFTAQAAWAGVVNTWEKLKSVTGELLHTAGEEERSGMVFRNMLGEDGGAKAMKFIDLFTEKTEFIDDEVKGLSATLFNAGFAGKTFEHAMLAIADTAGSSLTDRLGAAQRAAQVLGQVMMTGTMSPKTIARSLKLNPGALEKQMTQDFGVTPKALKKALAEKRVPIESVMRSIFKAVAKNSGGELGKIADGMATGFTARFAKFKNIIPNLFEGAADSPGLRMLGETMEAITQDFKPGGALYNSVTTGLSEGLTALAAIIKNTDWKNMATTLVDMFKALPPLIEGVATAIKGIGDLGVWLGESFGGFYERQSNPQTAVSRYGLMRPKQVSRGASGGFDMPDKSLGALGSILRSGPVVSPSALPGTAPAPGGIPPMLSRLPPGPIGGRGSVTVSAPINVNVAGTQASADQIAEAVKYTVPGAIITALEQMGYASGGR